MHVYKSRLSVFLRFLIILDVKGFRVGGNL